MKKMIIGLILTVFSSLVLAQEVQVNRVWTRATVPGQTSAGVFMEIVSPRDALFIKADTGFAKRTELHEMKMQGDVMKMRAVKSIVVPANIPTLLQPGGLHVMLMDLKAPLIAGEKLPMKLTFEFADKTREVVAVNAEVVLQTSTNTKATP